MNTKILGAFAAVALLAACAEQQAATTGAGGSQIVPGSQEDLVANVGDRVFFNFNAAQVRADQRATLDRQAA